MRKSASILRVGVVGIGFGQQAHIPAFQRTPGCEVTGVAATSYERARSVADRLRVPKAYGDWKSLLEDSDIDLISVATPPAVQPEIVLAALAEQKPVFCEKPMALNVEVARTMLESARRSGLAHMVDFEFVAIDEWLKAKEILDSGQLGRVHHACVSWHVETYAHRMGLKTWKTGNAETGGGTLASMVSHTFHYLEWLLGPIRRLSARLYTPGSNEACGDTGVVLGLESVEGASIAVSVCSDAFQGSGHRLEIYGDGGTLVLDNPTLDYVSGFRLLCGTKQASTLQQVEVRGIGTETKDGRVIAVSRLVNRFVRWVRDGIQSVPSFEDGYRVQCLMKCARLAHSSGEWVTVPEPERLISPLPKR
jgi:predicted dehydrogenase